MPIPIAELQKTNPSAIIELFTLTMDVTGARIYDCPNPIHGSVVDPVYRFHNGSNHSNGQVVWAGNSYQRFPIQASGFDFKGQTSGTLARPTLTASNIFGMFTDLMLEVNKATAGNDLQKCKLTRIRTLAKYLDAANFSGGNVAADPTQELPQEVYYIHRKNVETRELVEYECVSAFDLTNVRLPKRQFTRSEFPGIGAYI